MYVSAKLEELEKIIEISDLPILIYFYGSWCGPCRRMGPVFESMSSELEGLYKFVKIVVDDVEEEVMFKYKVGVVPTIIFIKDNKEVARLEGYKNKDDISKTMAQAFHKNDGA